MELAALLAATLTALNIALALRTIWQAWRTRRQPPATHPLESALRDIATAIRQTGHES